MFNFYELLTVSFSTSEQNHKIQAYAVDNVKKHDLTFLFCYLSAHRQTLTPACLTEPFNVRALPPLSTALLFYHYPAMISGCEWEWEGCDNREAMSGLKGQGLLSLVWL